MDQDNRWAGPDVQICYPLTMDENRLDRERFDRGACKWLEVRRNVCGGNTGRHERRYKACDEPRKLPEFAWVWDLVAGAITPVE